MRKKGIIQLAIFAVIISTVFSSCIKDYFELDKLSTNIEWNPNVAVAGVTSTLTIRDMLRDYDSTHLFVEDGSGFLFLIYNKRVFSVPARDIISVPNVDFTSQFVASEYTTQGFPNPTTTAQSSKVIPNIFAFTHGETLDSILLSSGDLNINYNTSFQHPGVLTITFPAIKRNGVPYTKSQNVIAGGTLNQTFSDLGGFTIDMSQSINNSIAATVTLALTSSGSTVISSHQANVQVSLSGLRFHYLFGNIGQYTINVNPDTVEIDIFKNAFNGYISFVDPKIRFNMINSFGLPLQFNFDNFSLFSSSLNGYNTYPFPIQYNPYFIMGASTINAPTYSTLQLDTLNFPVIRSVIEDNPRYLFFGVTGITNPSGYPPQYNFICDTSRFSVDMEVELPLWGRASGYILQDTVEFDVNKMLKDSDDVDLDNIDWVLIRMNTINGLPLDAGVQIYFTDTNYLVIDSLFANAIGMDIINSGVVGTSGKIVSPTHKQTDVKLDHPKVIKLKPVKKMLVRVYMKTTNNATQNVRFYSDYSINVKVGVQGQGRVNLNDLK